MNKIKSMIILSIVSLFCLVSCKQNTSESLYNSLESTVSSEESLEMSNSEETNSDVLFFGEDVKVNRIEFDIPNQDSFSSFLPVVMQQSEIEKILDDFRKIDFEILDDKELLDSFYKFAPDELALRIYHLDGHYSRIVIFQDGSIYFNYMYETLFYAPANSIDPNKYMY